MTWKWRQGDASFRAAVAAWLAAPATGTRLRDNPRRRLVRIPGPGGDLVVKHFRTLHGRHPLRERLKAWIGRSPARKEARALRTLHRAGAPVPAPLGIGALPDGEPFLLLPFLEGADAREVLTRPGADRGAALRAIAAAVRALHERGYVHRDLHHGNVRFGPDGVVLLDLQNARPTSGRGDERADVAALVYSLRGLLTEAETRSLADATLGRERGSDDDALRRAVAARADAHARSRTRRAQRPGRRFARWRTDSGRGLHLREAGSEAVRAWLAAHEAALREDDPAACLKREGRVAITRVHAAGRTVVVKQQRAGAGRALADCFRGSPAARAWRAGHGLLARDVPAALPLAYLEERRFGLPTRSLVILEAVEGPDGVEACGAAGALRAQTDLVIALHRGHVDHGDLKATNWIHRAGDGRATLVDLESVKFRRALPPTRRLEGLAQWNASLPDAVPARARREAFERYRAETHLDLPLEAAIEQIVARSLERGHRWSGADCACARRIGG